MGQIRGFFRSEFSAFGAPGRQMYWNLTWKSPGFVSSQMYWNLIWKSPGFVQFGVQSDPLWSQTYHPWLLTTVVYVTFTLMSSIFRLQSRGVRFGHKVGQIGTKCDKSGDIEDIFNTFWICNPKIFFKRHYFSLLVSIWPTLEPTLTPLN